MSHNGPKRSYETRGGMGAKVQNQIEHILSKLEGGGGFLTSLSPFLSLRTLRSNNWCLKSC